MPDRYQETHIRRVPLFQELSNEHLERVAQAFQARRYNEGELIVREGDPVRGMHIIIEGQAVALRMTPTGPQQVGLVRDGQVINAQALFQEGVESASLQAVRPVVALLLTRENFATLLSYYPDIARALGLAGGEGGSVRDAQFDAQYGNEETLLSTRRHWWVYIRWVWVPLLVMLLFWGLVLLLPMLSVAWIPLSLILPGVAAIYLYAEWANDHVIITDQRVIRITHTILTFQEVRDEVKVSSIQEVNTVIPRFDPFAFLLGYGNVEIKTAGREGNFMLDFMPNPEDLQNLILTDIREQNQRVKARERQTMRADMDRWLQGDPQKAKYEANTNESLKKAYKIGDGPLSPFVTRFETEGGGRAYRKHWLFWLGQVMRPLLLLLATGVFVVLLLTVSAVQVLGFIGWIIALVLFLIGAVWLYLADWDWRHDYYIVSDDYITLLSRRPLLLQFEDDQVLLQQVDNVKAESQGIFEQLFGYGDVEVALVGADESKVFRNVSKPLEVQQEISQRQGRIKQRDQEAAERQQREILGEYFKMYHDQYGGASGAQPEYPSTQATTPSLNRRTPGASDPRQPQPGGPRMSSARPYQPENYPTAGHRYPGQQQSAYPSQQQPRYPQQPPQPPQQPQGYPQQPPQQPQGYPQQPPQPQQQPRYPQQPPQPQQQPRYPQQPPQPQQQPRYPQQQPPQPQQQPRYPQQQPPQPQQPRYPQQPPQPPQQPPQPQQQPQGYPPPLNQPGSNPPPSEPPEYPSQRRSNRPPRRDP